MHMNNILNFFQFNFLSSFFLPSFLPSLPSFPSIPFFSLPVQAIRLTRGTYLFIHFSWLG
ncbi:predicted protein [Botrytis cinerea T4]|uniref:Uncharacterized protein n=1 Tax=Botryotinia fuckeliana (strain T4) TaxID=999810 RepID=G2Y4E0_BOTF4|nr:predicted protein [Botrytis cinerea T4]